MLRNLKLLGISERLVSTQYALKATSAVAASALNQNADLKINKINLKSYAEIPGPNAIPIMGTMHHIKKFGGEFDFLDHRNFIISLQKKYGDIVRWELFREKHVTSYVIQ